MSNRPSVARRFTRVGEPGRFAWGESCLQSGATCSESREPGEEPGGGAVRERVRAFWYGRAGDPVLTGIAPARGSVDQETLQRFRRGDQDAFLAIHDAHAPVISRLIGRFFPRPFEREEAVQEVWLLVLRVAGAFDPQRGALLAWLRVVATNRCRELLRARTHRPDAREELSDEEALPETNDPETLLRLGRLRGAVNRFSAGLTPEEAVVLKLSLLEERSHEEVAAAAGTSVRRCKYLRKKLLARAVADPQLRAVMDEVGW
jgi:RNA polymerase sigma factor (sigma-70 family)